MVRSWNGIGNPDKLLPFCQKPFEIWTKMGIDEKSYFYIKEPMLLNLHYSLSPNVRSPDPKNVRISNGLVFKWLGLEL